MKRQITCIIYSAIAAVLVIATVNYTFYTGKAVKITDEQITGQRSGSAVSVKDYIHDNYVASENSPWADYSYSKIDYVEAAAGLTQFSEKISAKAAILVDAGTKTVIYSKNENEHMHPASTTKLMTALTAVKILDFDDKITIGNEIGMIAADSSRAGFSKGQRLTFEELLEGLLISSGNDAAYVIAKAAGRELLEDNISYEGEKLTDSQCVERFVYEMNKKVRELGLKDTQFTTPDGYDADGQYVTASDLSKIALTAYEEDKIQKICSKASATSKTLNTKWISTNELLNKSGDYFYEYCLGMKTGSTDKAGSCLVSVAQKDNQTCISVVLDSTENGRWEDSLKLLKFGLK